MDGYNNRPWPYEEPMSLAEAVEHIKDELVITLDMDPDLRKAYQVIIEHLNKEL